MPNTIGSEITVVSSANGVYPGSASLLATDDGFFISWNFFQNGQQEAFGRGFYTDGTARAGAVVFSPGGLPTGTGVLGLLESGAVVVNFGDIAQQTIANVFNRLVDPAGNALQADQYLTMPADIGLPVFRYFESGPGAGYTFHITGVHNGVGDTSYAWEFNAGGVQVGQPTPESGFDIPYDRNLVTPSGDQYYKLVAGGPYGSYQLYNNNGTAAGPLLQAPGVTVDADVLSDGRLLVVWNQADPGGTYSARGQIFNLDGGIAPSGVQGQPFVIAQGLPTSGSPQIEVTGDDSFVVMWHAATAVNGVVTSLSVRAQAYHIDPIGGLSFATINGTGGDNELHGSAAYDTINAGAGNDIVYGRDGNDVIDAGEGRDIVHGGPGYDFIRAADGQDELYGESGSDTFFLQWSPGSSSLLTPDASWRVYGGSDGANGDTVDLSQYASAMWVDLSGLEASVWTRNGPNLNAGAWSIIATLVNVENFVSSSGDDFFRGSADNNTFGYVGGHDVADGLGGVNTVDFSNAHSAVWVDLGYGAGDEAWTRDGADVLSGAWRGIADLTNFQNVIGSSMDDQLYGIATTRLLAGGGGADTLFVRTLAVGSTVTVQGGNGNDTVDFSLYASALWIRLDYFGYEVWTRDNAGVTTGAWREVADVTGVENVIGTAYNDDIQGDGNANRIYYTGGVDILDGAGGTDTLDFSRFGSAVWVRIDGDVNVWTQDRPDLASNTWRSIGEARNFETIVGSNFSDQLIGSSFTHDTLIGGGGDDTLDGLLGNDILDGGAGNDTAAYSQYGAIIINLQTGVHGGYAGGDTLISIENIIGSGAADNITGSNGANRLDGGGGADILIGLDGDDTYVVDNVGDVVTENPGEGNDTVLSGMQGAYTLGANIEGYGRIGAGSYTVTGNTQDNVFFITALAVGSGATINGAANTAVGDTVDFTQFSASVWVNLAYAGVYEAWTTDTGNQTTGSYRPIGDLSGIENLVGSAYDDYLRGDANANRFGYTGGVDTIDGQGGSDTLFFNQFGSAVWVDLGATTNTVWTTGTLTQTGNWRVIGNVSNVENVVGGAGADFFRGTSAANLFDGAGGSDTVSYTNAGSGVVVDLGAGTATGGGGADTLLRIENVVGSAFIDTITGDSANNTLDGGADADTLAGGTGNDIYIVDALGDVVTENVSEGTDLIRSSVTAADVLDANVENYARNGTSGYAITGNASDNSFLFGAIAAGQVGLIDGDAGTDTADFSGFNAAVWVNLGYNNFEAWTTDTTNQSGSYRAIADLSNVENITGSAFDDYLAGNANANRFIYAGGNDTVDGAGGSDTLDYSRFGSAVWVDLNRASQSAWTTDTLGQTGTWRAIGNVSNVENVVGTLGADDLRGNAGVNRIEGGAGNDTLFGGGGIDTFVYQGTGGVLATGLDVITDFVHAVDLIEINSGLSQIAAAAALHIDNTGANSIITFDNSPTFQITVLNADLDQNDFVFV